MKKFTKMIKLLGICFLLLTLTACGALIDDYEVKKAVEKQGYRDVSITDKSIFFPDWSGCGEDDDACYDMIATNSNGQRIDLIACAGWPFKGVTVRTK